MFAHFQHGEDELEVVIYYHLHHLAGPCRAIL